jgi:ABC-type lipoprotein export system ATPase subunit
MNLQHAVDRHIARLLRTVVRSQGATALVAIHDSTLIDLVTAALSCRRRHRRTLISPPDHSPSRWS